MQLVDLKKWDVDEVHEAYVEGDQLLAYSYDKQMRIDNMYAYDMTNDKMTDISISAPISSISKGEKGLFYSSYDHQKNTMHIYLLDLKNFKDKKVCEIPIKTKMRFFEGDSDEEQPCSFLFSLSKRYAMISFWEAASSTRRYPHFYLVDARTCDYYAIDLKIGEIDYLNRLDEAVIQSFEYDNRSYLLLKTCPTFHWEKETEYKYERSTNQTQVDFMYYESFVYYEVESFVRNIKQKIQFEPVHIQDFSFDQSMRFIGVFKEYIFYEHYNFEEETSCIISYSILSKQSQLISDNVYELYALAKGKLLGLDCKNNVIKIYDVQWRCLLKKYEWEHISDVRFFENGKIFIDIREKAEVRYLENGEIIIEVPENNNTLEWDFIIIDVFDKNYLVKEKSLHFRYIKSNNSLVLLEYL